MSREIAFERFASKRPRLAQIGRVVALFVVSRFALAVFVWLNGQHFRCIGPRCTDRRIFPENLLLNGLFQWDALQYQLLAERGYFVGQGFETTAPFFPGFPLAAKLVGGLVGSPLLGGILVNNVAAIVGAVAIGQLARIVLPDVRGASIAAECIWLLGPLSFFFSVFLSESVFACATALTFLGAARRRWSLFAAAGFIATLTRNAGVAVVLCGLLFMVERDGWRSALKPRWLAAGAIALSGLLVVLAWQNAAFGDPFRWVAAQREWGRQLVSPIQTFREDWLGFPGLNPLGRNVDKMYRAQEVLAAALLAPLFFAKRWLKLPWSLWILGLLLWILPFLSHSVISFARYQAANLYCVLALAVVVGSSKTVAAAAWWMFGLVMAWYASTYPFGVWAS